MKKKLTTAEALSRLSLPSGSNKQAVKKRYRELAKMYHPDQLENYSEQADAIQRFIAIHEAYLWLMEQPDDEIHIPANDNRERIIRNPMRGSYTLPDWLLLRELKNTISLWRIINNRQIRISTLWSVVQPLTGRSAIRKEHNRLQRILFRFYNLIKWLMVSFLYLLIFIIAILLFASTLLCFAFFYPFLFLCNKGILSLINQYERKAGYRPSATCGHLKGELTYLFLRTLPVIMWCSFTYVLWMQYACESTFMSVLMAPLGLFAALLLTSNSYEWYCFLVVRKWRVAQRKT
jgi:hypothetical protein